MTVEDVLRGQIADLIDDVTHYKSVIEDLTGYSDTLCAENAKLRELIIDVYEALRADKVGFFHGWILASMEDDLRELGIEVAGK